METVAGESILLHRDEEHESMNLTGDTTIIINFEISELEYELSRCTLVFYDKISAWCIEIKLSILLNISMIFLGFGLLLSAMNCSFTESRGTFIVLSIWLTFIFALLSLSVWNQSKMINDADILKKQIENELELENESNSTNKTNNNNAQCGIVRVDYNISQGAT